MFVAQAWWFDVASAESGKFFGAGITVGILIDQFVVHEVGDFRSQEVN